MTELVYPVIRAACDRSCIAVQETDREEADSDEVLAAGAISAGALSAALADDCPWDITLIQDIEGPLAQDVNMDGIATIAEGSFDIDFDGWFTQVEADALGLCDFINWKPTACCAAITTWDNSVCSVKQGGCVGVQNDYVCRSRGTGPCWSEWWPGWRPGMPIPPHAVK